MKKYLALIGLVTGLLLSGCNSGTGSNTGGAANNVTPVNNTATKVFASTADGVESYTLGNVLKLVSNGTTLKPDNDKGLLGFYITNGINSTATEQVAGKGKLDILIPNAEKSYFSNTKTSLAAGEHPELGNPLAPQTIKDMGADYKAFGWQLAQNGIDENVHNIFFKYNDPTAGEDVFFKVVSKPVTASSAEITNATDKINSILSSQKQQANLGESTWWNSYWFQLLIIIIIVVVIILISGGTGTPGLITAMTFVRGSVTALSIFGVMSSVVVAFGGSMFVAWLNTTRDDVAMTASVSTPLKMEEASFTYRQLRLEPVTSADVAAYPELKLQPSKVAVTFGGTIMGQRIGFVPVSNTSGIANYYVDLGGLDTLLNPKNTHGFNKDNPNDLSYLKEDGYLGNRMPENNYKVMNHYLDGVMQLTVMPAGVNALSGYTFDAFNQAANDNGYLSNAFINAEPDVGIKSISNVAGNGSLEANAVSLEKGLSYVNREGVKTYNPISINPGDKLALTVKNPVLNTAMRNQNGSEQKYMNLSMLVADVDSNTGIGQTSKKALSTSDRPLVFSADSCDNLQPGKSCSVSLDFGSVNSESSFSGVFYVSDATSKLTAVPFTYNIQMLLSPSILTNGLGSDTAEGKFMNRSKKALAQLSLDRGDLAKEATASMNCYDANNVLLSDKEPTVPANGYCKIKLGSLDDIDTGSYHLQVKSKGSVIYDIPVQVQ